jgi:hypothetical protein
LPIKIFISSRRDEKISEFNNVDDSVHSALILHDIEEDLVKEDIRRYMTAGLDKISKGFKVERNTWISNKDLSPFAERAGTLFVYASALCSYLDCRKEAIARVQSLRDESTNSVAGSNAGSKEKTSTVLDNLYTQIHMPATAQTLRHSCNLLWWHNTL